MNCEKNWRVITFPQLTIPVQKYPFCWGMKSLIRFFERSVPGQGKPLKLFVLTDSKFLRKVSV